MSETYLEVCYRHGRPIAAYYYLPRRPGQKSHRTRELAEGILVDYSRGGQPIGIEIITPGSMTVTRMNRVLRMLGQSPVTRRDLAPLRAA